MPPPALLAALQAERNRSAPNASSEEAVATLICLARGLERRRPSRLIRATRIILGQRRLLGGSKEGAIVVTETVKETGDELVMLSEPGDGVQMASEGAPVQASVTVPAKPSTGINWRLNVALCPADTVAEVELPLAG